MGAVDRGRSHGCRAHGEDQELWNQLGHGDRIGRRGSRIVMFQALFVSEVTAISAKRVAGQSLRHRTEGRSSR